MQKQSYDILKSDFITAVYEYKECPPFYDDPAPTWANGLNKIYTNCSKVNVGINTNIPRVRLDVIGTAFMSRISLGYADPTNMGTRYFHLKMPTSQTGIDSSTIFLVENQERELFQINNDGKVRTREIIVDTQTPWPDYVFEDDYSLMSLKEIESFVNENGHLPNIPSAQTIQETGVDVGEMNRLLLEKIEELTLHIIQQQKEIDTLKTILEDH